jgi:hypothetical protein
VGAAITRGVFAEADRLFEQATGIARVGGDLADASVELCLAVANRVYVGDAPGAVPLAREALALARRGSCLRGDRTACVMGGRPEPIKHRS